MSYTKDTSTAKSFPVFNKRVYYGTGFPILDFNRKVLTRTRSGDRNPFWRKQVKAQTNAGTQMTGIIDTIEATSGYCEHQFLHPVTGELSKSFSNGYLAVGLMQAMWNPTIASTLADNRAMQSYLKSVKSTQRSFSGLTFLGELRETLRMIRKPGEGLRHLLENYLLDVKKRKRLAKDDAARRKLRGRKKREAEDVWKKDLSSMWLEHSFGWTPLVHDIEDAVNAYERARDRRLGSNQRAVSGYGSEMKETPGKNLFDDFRNHPPAVIISDSWYKGVERAEVKYRGMVKVDNTAIPIQNAKLFGLTPAEFIPTAWELLPWSFLIDYFTNIGDVLENMITDTSSLAWTNRSTIRTAINTVVQSINVKDTMASKSDSVSCRQTGSTKAVQTRRFVNRDVGVSTYVPPISFELPGRPAQWANMTALFAQAASVHPQRRPH